MQYLTQRFHTVDELQKYTNWLWNTFPEEPTAPIQQTMPLPIRPHNHIINGVEQPCFVHISQLSFSPAATPREPTRSKTCLELMESFLLDTFLTEHEPLLLCTGGVKGMMSHSRAGLLHPRVLGVHPALGESSNPQHEPPLAQLGVDSAIAQEAGTIMPFSLAHHKSAARTSSLHMFLVMVMDDDVPIREVHPQLWQSIRRICAWDLEFPCAREEAFSNFKMSARGSIRKPPSLLSWCIMLQKLHKKGERDTAAVVRLWNSQAGKSHQLVGAKSTSVRNLMELCPEEALRAILRDVSAHGWENSPWSDEVFGSKKIFPGQHTRCTTKEWTSRLIVTPQSLLNMLERIINLHNAAPPTCQRKVTKLQAESMAQLAALATSLAAELISLKVPQKQCAQSGSCHLPEATANRRWSWPPL